MLISRHSSWHCRLAQAPLCRLQPGHDELLDSDENTPIHVAWAYQSLWSKNFCEVFRGFGHHICRWAIVACMPYGAKISQYDWSSKARVCCIEASSRCQMTPRCILWRCVTHDERVRAPRFEQLAVQPKPNYTTPRRNTQRTILSIRKRRTNCNLCRVTRQLLWDRSTPPDVH